MKKLALLVVQIILTSALNDAETIIGIPPVLSLRSDISYARDLSGTGGSVTVFQSSDIHKLPLVITAAKVSVPDAPVALLISGDGGWYWFEQSLADHLSALGIPTVGIDSRKYLWNRKTPEQVAADIANAMKYYGACWGKKKFMLAGYSYGAEVVPFIINRAGTAFRENIVSAVLLSPDITTDFEIHLSNMIGAGNRNNTFNVADEIQKIKNIKVLAIFGEDEKSVLPSRLAGSGTSVRFIPGDHHYKFNVSLIMQVMKNAGAY